jgi:hypothetical protein
LAIAANTIVPVIDSIIAELNSTPLPPNPAIYEGKYSLSESIYWIITYDNGVLSGKELILVNY